MTKGLSTDDEPDIWQKSLSGEPELWIALGLPSEKVVRQFCGKADEMVIYSDGGRTADMWWEKVKNSTTLFGKLQVVNFSQTDTSALEELAYNNMAILLTMATEPTKAARIIRRSLRDKGAMRIQIWAMLLKTMVRRCFDIRMVSWLITVIC